MNQHMCMCIRRAPACHVLEDSNNAYVHSLPFGTGGVNGPTLATRMGNHPGNPLEKHYSKRTDGTNIDLDTYLGISFRRRIKPFTLSWAAGTSSPYILSSSEAHDCVRGFLKTNFDWSVFGAYLYSFPSKGGSSPHTLFDLRLAFSTFTNRIVFGKLRCPGKHKIDYRVSTVIDGKRTGRVGDVRERAQP